MINIDKKNNSLKKNEIISKIYKFDAGCFIDDLYMLIAEIHEEVEGDWTQIFNSKEQKKTFSIYIRNLIRRGIISEPSKIKSKNFLFKPRNVLEILVIRGCTSNGIKMTAAKLYIQELSDDRLKDRIMGPVSLLNEKIRILKKYKQFLLEIKKEEPVIPDKKKFVHIKVGASITLQLKDGIYNNATILKMIICLKNIHLNRIKDKI